MELNLRWIMATMRSISLGEMGRVRDCSLSRFITWLVNSLQALGKKKRRGEMLLSKMEQSRGSVLCRGLMRLCWLSFTRQISHILATYEFVNL